MRKTSITVVGVLLVGSVGVATNGFSEEFRAVDRQITTQSHGHVLTNAGVWSADSEWIVYDVRSDAAGEQFDGQRIERVHVATGEVQVLFRAEQGAMCGVATCSPSSDHVVFIHGPEHPDEEWSYGAARRRGVLVKASNPRVKVNLDARDLVPPFTAGALRGGTHVHTFSGDGQWVAFTYEDHLLQNAQGQGNAIDLNQRAVGVSAPTKSVSVPATHPRNHDGSYFTTLVARTTNHPRPGSDQISRAFSDAWIGQDGYRRLDGTQQKRAIAFQGHVHTNAGLVVAEVFLVDLPDDLTQASPDGPLQGTATTRPQPPLGTLQRRLTYTTDRDHPGIQGVRHWLRSSPDGSKIAFLMKSSDGVSQLWTVSPLGGEPTQLTKNTADISSAFTWNAAGTRIAHTMDQSVCVTDTNSGQTIRLTTPDENAIVRPEACVFSPDGNKIAYVRHVRGANSSWNQIFVLDISQANESLE